MLKRHEKGFSLTEILFALVIVGILLAIAIPSYYQYQLRAHRSEGVNALNNIQLQQEKYRLSNTSYGTLAQVWGGVTSTANGYYALAASNIGTTGYTLTATAQGDQAADTQSGTSCLVLTLTVNGLSTTRTPAACWNR